jgi:hypothetical protein
MGDATPAAYPALHRAASCTPLTRLYFASIHLLPGLLSLSLSLSLRFVQWICYVRWHCFAIWRRSDKAKVDLTLQLALLCDLETIHLLFSHFSLTNLDGYYLTADFFFCIACHLLGLAGS